jgi:hypothetical protein
MSPPKQRGSVALGRQSRDSANQFQAAAVGNPRQSPRYSHLVRVVKRFAKACRDEKTRPYDAAPVNAVGLDPRPFEKLGGARSAAERTSQTTQRNDKPPPTLTQAPPDVPQHVATRDPLHHDRATGWQVCEPVLDLLLERNGGPIRKAP